MEDLFSSIIVGLIAIISIVIKAMGNKAKNSGPEGHVAPELFGEEEQTEMPKPVKRVDISSHPDSLETIFEEISGNNSTIERVEVPQTEVKPKRKENTPKRINATNRTFKREEKQNTQVVEKEPTARKRINLRDAIIYSEIITPKFKNEE